MINRATRIATALVGVAAFALVAAGCSGTSSASSSTSASPGITQNAALKKLVSEAKKEDALNITWANFDNTTNPEFISQFEKDFGLNIPIKITLNDNFPALASKVLQENAAGITSSSDLTMTSTDYAIRMGSDGQGVIKAVDWASFAPWTKGLSDENGEFLSIEDGFPGFIYNTNAFTKADLPKTAADVLKITKPIASTAYAASFNLLGIKMGVAGTEQYVKEFKPAGFIDCSAMDRIASGEFDGLWIGCGKSSVDTAIKSGAPIGFEIVKDAAFENPTYLAVPKNSAHPAAAELFAAWLDSPHGQAIMLAKDGVDNAGITGSSSAKYLAQLRTQGIDPVLVNIAFAHAHPQLYSSAFKSELVTLLTKK